MMKSDALTHRHFPLLASPNGALYLASAGSGYMFVMWPGGHVECPGRKPKGHAAVLYGFQLPVLRRPQNTRALKSATGARYV